VILAGGTTFPTTTPDLTPLEQDGKVTFDPVCATCHGAADHPSGSTPTIGQRYHRIRSQCPRQPTRTPAQSLLGLPEEQQFGDIQLPACDAGTTANSRIYAFVDPTGIITNKQRSDDIGRAFFTGRFSDANAFDVSSLHGISQTAPYFHNNSAATLEDVVEFYRVLFPAVARDFRVGALPAIVSTDGKQFDRFFTSAQAPGLVAYLKRLGAKGLGPGGTLARDGDCPLERDPHPADGALVEEAADQGHPVRDAPRRLRPIAPTRA